MYLQGKFIPVKLVLNFCFIVSFVQLLHFFCSCMTLWMFTVYFGDNRLFHFFFSFFSGCLTLDSIRIILFGCLSCQIVSGGIVIRWAVKMLKVYRIHTHLDNVFWSSDMWLFRVQMKQKLLHILCGWYYRMHFVCVGGYNGERMSIKNKGE